MSYLIDTNILLRSVDPNHTMNAEAISAVENLLAAGETVNIFPQNISEFWNVATRPLDKNGLGLTPAQANAEVDKLENLLKVVLDTPQIYKEWRKLGVDYAVSGVNVHDARLVAAMIVHGISHILTFNAKDFRRFEPIISVKTPREIITEYLEEK